MALALSVTILSGCTEKTTDSVNDGPASYLPEYDPSLSFDGTTVYLGAFDSLGGRGGIYRASLVNPVRELVVPGDSLSSPAVSPDNQRLAFMHRDTLILYDLTTNSRLAAATDAGISDVTFVNDTLLAGTDTGPGPYQGTVRLIATRDFSARVFADGYDVVRYSRDTLLYLARVYGSAAAVVRMTCDSLSSDTIQWAFGLLANELARWPSVDRTLGHLTYSHWRTSGIMVKATTVADSLPWPPARNLATSTIDRTLIISPDRVLYGGFDGRLWESNFAGTSQRPFWATYDPD